MRKGDAASMSKSERPCKQRWGLLSFFSNCPAASLAGMKSHLALIRAVLCGRRGPSLA